MHEGAKRVAENEIAFRRANDRVASRAVAEADSKFLCECGDLNCTSMIELTLQEYRQVRSEPHCFALVPGHEVGEVEVIVEQRGEYVVVKKRGEAARVVEARPPAQPPETTAFPGAPEPPENPGRG